MRFIHMADVHFDSPFTVLASRENLANERRLEQRKAFADTIEYIKENQIPFLQLGLFYYPIPLFFEVEEFPVFQPW